MTATLTDAIEAAKQREQIARWNSGEARLAAELPIKLPAIELFELRRPAPRAPVARRL
jgi:hypothetical protein